MSDAPGLSQANQRPRSTSSSYSSSSSSSSNINTRNNNKPVSMQYKLSDGPPGISDADRRAKNSNNVDSTTEDGTADKAITIGKTARGDNS
uniref:Uncharacterized protein n=1 Tax=Tanacetum cinerariifolium TaxID=118510 RepID=A0A699HAW7_TANCI|nr:hypothetical protein [Tanacetum cinerariifolium]